MSLPSLMIAPNGARLQKADHPELPITIEETVDCALDCWKAGANGLHLHIRDNSGGHLLDEGVYREALAELSHQVPDLPVQITTEAVGKYTPEVQRRIALMSGANLVSVSVREMLRGAASEFVRFNYACSARGIAVQHILYDLDDCACLQSNLPSELLESPDLQIIFVLGRYTMGEGTNAGDLQPFLNWLRQLETKPDWAVCAFGKEEATCLVESVKAGGKCRIGFENSLFLPDGSIAKNNAEKVRAFLQMPEATVP